MKMSMIGAALIISTVIGGSAAHAQDFGQPAAFGSAQLRTGFTPDPHVVSLTAGGSIDASNVNSACRGMIANAPDYKITYTAGSLPLAFRTRSSSDTTLVINGPDGRWYCDDDSAGDLDAQIVFNNPRSGTYDVWVGTFGSNTARASLQITEVP